MSRMSRAREEEKSEEPVGEKQLLPFIMTTLPLYVGTHRLNIEVLFLPLVSLLSLLGNLVSMTLLLEISDL